MNRNYLKIIFRQLRRNKLYSFISLSGLTVGLASTFYIALFIYDELSFESFHGHADQVYRVSMHIEDKNYDVHWARVDRDWVKQMKANLPEVEELVRFQDYDPRFIQVGTKNFKVSQAFTTDPEVFNVFDFELVSGNPKNALSNPYSVVLSESMSKTFFGSRNAMGKEIKIIDNTGEKKQTFKVTGVMKDLPGNTHLPVNLLTSFSSAEERTGWAYTYIKSDATTSAGSLQQKVNEFIKTTAPTDDANTVSLPLQPLKSIHLDSDLAREIVANGKMSHLWLFGGIGLFILFMSVINFVNLNAAQSLRRLKEIGIRKVLGSGSGQLRRYFFLESMVITLLGAVCALLLVNYLIPVLKDVVTISTPIFIIAPLAVVLVLLIALLASFFPSFILSRQGAMDAVKNKLISKSSRSYVSPKNILVAIQLILCIAFLSGAMITRSQFNFLTEKELGIQDDLLVAIQNVPWPVKSEYELFKNELTKQPYIAGVSSSMEVPSREIQDAGPIYAEGKVENSDKPPIMDIQVVDHDFLDVMEIQLLAGRNFLAKTASEPGDDVLSYLQEVPREYIINETALTMAGWSSPEEAIGKQFGWSIGGIQLQKGPVVGVMKDFHQESLKNKIQPVVMITEPIWVNNFLIKLKAGSDVRTAIRGIEKVWNANFADFPMEYAFVDELYDRIYESEQKQLQLVYFFSAFAILIAFMGIFGLMAYAMKSREKELAIRKILGATLSSITILLSKKFLYLALVGMILAIPLTWYGMESWLNNFVYRIDINVFSFILAILATLIILLITMIAQVKKVSKQNPVEALRVDQ